MDEFLAGAAAELQQIDGLAEYREGQFPVVLTPNPTDMVTAELPRLGKVRDCIRLKALQVLDRAMAGDNSRLGNDVEIMLRHTDILSRDPFLVAALTCNACDALTLSVLEQSLGVATANEGQLSQIGDLLEARETGDRLSQAMRGERAFFIALCDAMRTAGFQSRLPGVRGWHMWDEANGIRLYNQLVQAAQDRATGGVVGSIYSKLGQIGASSIMTQISLPSVLKSFELDARDLAARRCARAAMAVEEYRLATGGFPRDWPDLVPRFLRVVPRDPFASGTPLRLLITPKRAVVYSVGPNAVDDGADVIPGASRNASDLGFTLLSPSVRGKSPDLDSAAD